MGVGDESESKHMYFKSCLSTSDVKIWLNAPVFELNDTKSCFHIMIPITMFSFLQARSLAMLSVPYVWLFYDPVHILY